MDFSQCLSIFFIFALLRERDQKRELVITILLTPWTCPLLCKKAVPLSVRGLSVHVEAARAYRPRLLVGFLRAGEGRCSVVGDICKRCKKCFRKILAWVQLGSVIEDLVLAGLLSTLVVVSELSHKGNDVSSSNLKVGWTLVRKLLWCCSAVQPSVGIGIARVCCAWWHMVNAGPPPPLLLCLASS